MLKKGFFMLNQKNSLSGKDIFKSLVLFKARNKIFLLTILRIFMQINIVWKAAPSSELLKLLNE